MLMVNIITGSINSGKTNYLIQLYNNLQLGDGFVSIKNMDNHKVLGYDVMCLSTKEKRSLVLNKDYVLAEWQECCSIGPYSFSKEAVDFVESRLRKLMVNKVTPIFLDEIGPLEIQGQCFHQIFLELLNSGCELYITVRENSIMEVIQKYQIQHKKLIHID